MVTTLKNGKARLSELVERAARGEEVIITVRGRPKARLCAVAPEAPVDRTRWAGRLCKARARWSTGKGGTTREILDALREDRA